MDAVGERNGGVEGSGSGFVSVDGDPEGRFWPGRPVLVTGATGLVGSALVPALVRAGANVVALIRDVVPHSLLISEGWLDRIQTVRGSFTDVDVVRRSMAEYGIRTVFHLGAQTLVGVAKADPSGTLENNVRGTWTVLESARQTGVKQTLIASSVLVSAETLAANSRHPYEVSKMCCERIANMYAETFRHSVGIVRCGNIYGGGDLNFSRLVPGGVMAALRGQPFRFRTDGKLQRDFLYVEDVADAYMRLAQRLEENPELSACPFSFGLGERHAVADVVAKIAVALGRSDLKPVLGNAPGSEISEKDVDSTLAREKLGWTPQFTLDEGIARTVAWYRKRFAAAADEVCIADGPVSKNTLKIERMAG